MAKNTYSDETKEHARELVDQGYSYHEAAKELGIGGSQPSGKTVKCWCDPSFKKQQLARQKEAKHKEAAKWTMVGATKHGKPKRNHFCQCDHKVVARTLRPDDPKMCLTCSHEVKEESDAREADHGG